MDDKQRTKLLACLLGGVLVFMAIRPDRMLLGPINEAEKDLANAEQDLEKAEAKQMELMVARERISRAEQTSLPPRATDAQRLYQSWITNLAEQCRFSQLDVQPGNKTPVRGQFATVDVSVEAETDLEGLSRFLYLFEQADLMHRISSLEINSTGASGKPRMEIVLTAEGMSMPTSAQRADIFARTSLPEELAEDATELRVAEAADFPKKTPFFVQVGREMIQVTSTEGGTWKVQRGMEGTKTAKHAADEVVSQFPVSPLRKDSDFSDYDTFLNGSPFVKPTPERVYKPRLASVSDRTIAPGDKVEMTARAEDMNPDVGEAEFSLLEPVEGMTINPKTGKFVWETAEDLEPNDYITTVLLKQANNDELKLEKKVTITVKLPNSPPVVKAAESAIVVIGQEFSLDVSGEDDSDPASLKFELDGDVPEGLTIEERTLKWTPTKTFKPGEYTVSVKVTDAGSPPKSASQDIKLTVKDDDAILTMFTGSVALDGRPVAWFRNTAKNERPELQIGDRIVAAEIDAELTEISRRHVLLADAGGIWKVQLGDNLRQRVLIEPAKPKEPESDASKSDNATAVPPTEDAESPTDYDKDPPAEKSSTDSDKTPPKASEVPAEVSQSTTTESTTEETVESKSDDSTDE